VHRIDDNKRLSGVAVHQVAGVALTQGVQNARLVQIPQLSQVLNAIKLRRICLQTTTVNTASVVPTQKSLNPMPCNSWT